MSYWTLMGGWVGGRAEGRTPPRMRVASSPCAQIANLSSRPHCRTRSSKRGGKQENSESQREYSPRKEEVGRWVGGWVG